MGNNLLNINSIYYEPAVLNYSRGQEIFARHPDAARIEVASHWNIPELHRNEALVEDWNKVKRDVLVLGVKKTLKCTPFYRSCDFVAPSHANGCAMACVYCVTADTLISTPQGPIPIDRIRKSSDILAFDTSLRQLVATKATNIASREVDGILEIQTEDTTLRATAEHPIMTRRGWIQAEELTVQDFVLHSMPGELLDYKKIEDIHYRAGQTRVYNFHVPEYESYVANGFVTHNCYVARRKGFANPITTFVNSEQICATIEKHAGKQGFKWEPSQADPTYWVYELGTNSDCSVDAMICDNVKDLVALFRHLPNAKGTFATKYVNRDLLTYDPQGKTRMRFSLMPASISRVVDVRTAPISERIAAINDFYAAGYEVNINLGPIIYYENWLEDYKQLFEQIDDTLSSQAKEQLQAEVIFLTHNEELHKVNLQWHPKAEALLWKPELQEVKVSQAGGGQNLRYKLDIKRDFVNDFRTLLNKHLPYCTIRYAF